MFDMNLMFNLVICVKINNGHVMSENEKKFRLFLLHRNEPHEVINAYHFPDLSFNRIFIRIITRIIILIQLIWAKI